VLQHLSKTSQDVTKRWVNEAQEAVNSDNIMVQVGTALFNPFIASCENVMSLLVPGAPAPCEKFAHDIVI
jgi:hypothetical protein